MGDPKWKELVNNFADEIGEQLGKVDWAKINKDISSSLEDGVKYTSMFTYLDFLGDKIKGEVSATETVESVTNVLAQIISDVMSDSKTVAIAEAIGAVITEPFVSVLEEYSEKEDYSAIEFSRAFHGATALLTIIRIVLAGAETSVFGFKLGPVAEAFGSMYWNLGLGFLGWQTLAPLLSSGLQPKLTRYYNAKYMPNVFDLDAQVVRFHLDQIGLAELVKTGKELGWSSDKIMTVIDHGYRTLTRSDMNLLYNKGQISLKEINDELIKQGYNPKYTATIAHDFIKEIQSDERLPSLATARKAYKQGFYTTTQFTTLLNSLGYGKEAIQLEISLANQALKQEQQELTISQVKQAFSVGEVSETEVRVFLQTLGYQQEQIIILLNTWNAAKKPKILKLNKGSITAALRRNVLTAGEAGLRLREIGYEPVDADIIIKTALASGGVSGHSISISKLLQAFSIDAITQADLTARLKARDISDADIRIYIAVALHEEVTQLTERDIQQAFLYGVLDNASTLTNLAKLDYATSDAQLLLQTWLRQKESFRLRLTPGLVILYYRQGLIPSDQLRRKLIELGFSNTDAELMVKSADLAYPRELTSNEIRDLYLTNTVNQAKAISLLQATGLAAGPAQLLVKSWSGSQGDIRPQPTVSQYLTAFRNTLLTESEFAEKLQALGYDQTAINFYIRLAGEVETEITKSLSKTDVLGLFDDNLISYTGALERLIDMGYTADDSELLLARRKPTIKDSQAHKLFMAGYIEPFAYPEVLLGLGFTPDDVDQYLEAIGF